MVKSVNTLRSERSLRKGLEVQVLSPAPEVTCSELEIWSDFAEAKIALEFSPKPFPPTAEAVKSHNSPQRMETVLSLISGLEPIF